MDLIGSSACGDGDRGKTAGRTSMRAGRAQSAGMRWGAKDGYLLS